MIRKTMTVLAGAAFAAALVTSPANAAAPAAPMGEQAEVGTAAWSACPAARMCIWTGLDGNGGIGIFQVGDGDLGDSSGPRGLNNATESGWNRTSQTWCFYDGTSYSSLLGTMAPGERYNWHPTKRNKVTSLRVCP
ncbi:peptidase inhibitor family I36 protein [Lentzea sp. NPDC055074]